MSRAGAPAVRREVEKSRSRKVDPLEEALDIAEELLQQGRKSAGFSVLAKVQDALEDRAVHSLGRRS